jgi:hypothetical protein
VRTRIAIAAVSCLLMVSGGLLGTAEASADCSGATRPAGATYQVEICFTAPGARTTVSGDVIVRATINVTLDAGGTSPGIESASFRIRQPGTAGLGVYLLNDAGGTGTSLTRTYAFVLPTYRWADNTWTLIAKANMFDGFTTTPGATVNVQFNNSGINPWKPETFAPRTPAPAGNHLVVTAVGDGAIDSRTADDVSSELAKIDGGTRPDMFLYLGDVYNVGSLSEYYNWYGARPGTPACSSLKGCGNWGQFYGITNPAAGVHEYNAPPVPDQRNGTTESGYVDYWGMPAGPDDSGNVVRHYYSYDDAGWHFISLDSTDSFRCGTDGAACAGGGVSAGWGEQYTWLKHDLATNTSACTIAYWHHPYWGMKTHDENGLTVGGGVDVRLTNLYQLMFDRGVDILLTGHQHNFQRWRPLDPSGAVNRGYGIHEIVDGAGGHPFGYFTRTDDRLASGIDRSGDAFSRGSDVGPSPNGTPAGVIKLDLYGDHADYGYVLAGGRSAGRVFDSATIPCHTAPPDQVPPTPPTDLRGSADSSGVSLRWTASSSHDVAGYEIYRAKGVPSDCASSCVQVGTTNGPGTAFTDPHVDPGTAYTYAIRARDDAGNLSRLSVPIVLSTP